MHDSDAQPHNRWLDPAIAGLAGRQHGVVARTQLSELGMDRGAIALRIERRRLQRVHRGVYAVGHRILTQEGRWMAAVLAAGPDAVLSHLSAGALWGMISPRSRAPDVTTVRRLRRSGIHFHHSCLPDDEHTTHAGIPITTSSRTLFDLAGMVSVHQLRRAVHEAEIRRLWDSLSLASLLERHPRRPGAGAIRELIRSPDVGITRGIFEERFLDFLAANRFSRPATNAAFHLGDRFIEPDCVWWDERVIVELDDHTTHGTRFAYERDRARDRALTAAGWRVIRITWRQLRDEPEALAADLRAALAQRPIAESLSR
jgi:very-short-patch-repair endonuclease